MSDDIRLDVLRDAIASSKLDGQKGNSKAGEDEYETGREFPMMFDIADRAQKHKAKKAKQKGYK